VQFTAVQATDWQGIFIADLAAEGARLGEAKVVRFARRPASAAGDAREMSRVG
jgi:hypothetical protein